MSRLTQFEERLAASELDYRVHRVLEYARYNLRSDLHLLKLAAAGNVSGWHLCRLFRTGLGMSPGRSIKFLRMRSAADLLATTSLSVKQIMGAVGLEDESHFVRDFKDAVGKSPTQFRQDTFRLRKNYGV